MAMRKSAAAAGTALFFALAPGIVAGVVPWWLTGWTAGARHPVPVRAAGIVMVAVGAAVLIHAFVRFVSEGLGTPAPAAPTQRLVVGGLYHYVRNPMYLAVLATITGQALVLGRPILLAYAMAVAAAFAAFVYGYEEPTLARRYGAAYEDYRRTVPAWYPRLPRRRDGSP
jgi:protein-S-isoprenylcysteine O-methyltransferase Ste14